MSKISSKSLYLAGFSRKSIFMFCNFAKNSKIQNGRDFWRVKIFFGNRHGYSAETLWVKNFDEIALSSTVFEI